MTRQELDLLCHPLSPEEALEELQLIYNGYGGDNNPLEVMPGMLAIRAAGDILRREIEVFNEPPSVRAARIMF